MGEQGSDDNEGTNEPFGKNCKRDIGKILRVLDDERFPSFWNKVRTECLEIRRGIETSPNGFKIAPFDATLTQRIQWLNINVLNPIQKLEAAIAKSNNPHFRHWEEYGNFDKLDRTDFGKTLKGLKREAKRLVTLLNQEMTGETAGKIAHTDEMRHCIVYLALGEVHFHFSEIKLSRGTWDSELGIMAGQIPDYVRRLFLETTGQHEQLDGPIELNISEFRKHHTIFD